MGLSVPESNPPSLGVNLLPEKNQLKSSFKLGQLISGLEVNLPQLSELTVRVNSNHLLPGHSVKLNAGDLPTVNGHF